MLFKKKKNSRGHQLTYYLKMKTNLNRKPKTRKKINRAEVFVVLGLGFLSAGAAFPSKLTGYREEKVQ